MSSHNHGFGFKLLMHMIAGLWFAATAFVWMCVFGPWQNHLPKGRTIDLPGMVLRASWQYAIELIQAKGMPFLPLILISSFFGSLFLVRMLYENIISANIAALVRGFLVALPTYPIFVIVLAAIEESQSVYPRIGGFVFFVYYLGVIGLYTILPTLLITYAASGWVLYRGKLICECIWTKVRPAS
jgi:hypothetical protein